MEELKDSSRWCRRLQVSGTQKGKEQIRGGRGRRGRERGGGEERGEKEV